MLEVDVRKAAVASNRIAIPITENLVFAFDGVKTRWKTALVRIHRADLAKHCKGARGNWVVHPGLSDAHSFSVHIRSAVRRSCDDF